MTKLVFVDTDPRVRVCAHCAGSFTVKYPSDRRIFCGYSCSVKSRPPRVDQSNSNWRGGKTKHPHYLKYMDMVARCHRPTHLRYTDYGGRGIQVCERWRNDFWAYVEDIGPAPITGERMTVDRIDNDGNYEPGNVRWATYTEQTRNRRKYTRRVVDGKRSSNAKLTEAAVRDIRTSSDSNATLAAKYGVSDGAVWQAKAGKTWTHVTIEGAA